MAFVGVLFNEEDGGGALAVVIRDLYDKLLKKGEKPSKDSNWQLYKIERCFLECG